MIAKCAWCNKILRGDYCKDVKEEKVTHGICQECEESLTEEAEKEMIMNKKEIKKK